MTPRSRRWTLPLLALLLACGGLWPAAARAEHTVWEVTTYGNGALLKSAFQAIGLFASEGLTASLKLAALVGLLGAIFTTIGSVVGGRSSLLAIPHVALAAGIVGTASYIQVPVSIVDKVAATADIVAGVPLPIAVIGYVTSTFGERLTEKVEQAIQPVDFERFTQTGLGWGPRVMQATIKATLMDQSILSDLDAYIRLCVIPDINTQHKTPEAIAQATTVDAMLGDTNPAIEVLLPSQCNSQGLPDGCQPVSDNQVCPDAYTTYLKPKLDQAVTSTDFLKTMALQIGVGSPQAVLPAVTDVASQLLQVSQDGAELLKLRFVANQFLPSVQASAALGGQSALLTAWSLSEAEAQRSAAWLTTGLILQQTLPVFHAALEFLFYGFLLFGIPLIIILPRIFPHILANAIWLQLWPMAYVFGNTFLYQQAQKAGLYSSPSGLNWGLSMAATHPLSNSFDLAYAASGFPIAIGVMMLGGMIFGGGYAIQKAIQAGPWHEAGFHGSSATLGNVSMGNVSLEQRHAVPLTERMGLDLSGDPAIITERGNATAPFAVTRLSPTGETTTLGAGEQSSAAWRSADNMFHVGFTPQGLAASHDLLTIAGSAQTRAALAETYNRSQAETRSSAQRLGETVASRASEAVRITEGLSQQTGDQKLEAARTAVRHSLGTATERALHQSETFSEGRRQAEEKGLDTHLGLGWNYILKVGGQTQIGVRDAHGKEATVVFSGDSAQRFTEAFGREASRDTALQHSLSALQSAAREHGVTVDLSTMQTQHRDFATAQSTEQRAGVQLETASTIGRLVDRKELGDYLEYRWSETGHAGPLGDARLHPRTQAEAEAFLRQEHQTILQGGSQLEGQILEYTAAHPQHDATALRDSLRQAQQGIAPVQADLPSPQSAADFHTQHGDPPSGPGESTPLHREIERGLAGGPAAGWQREADRARGETSAVPSAESLQGNLTARTGEVTERSTPQQVGQVAGKVWQEGKNVVSGNDTPDELPIGP